MHKHQNKPNSKRNLQHKNKPTNTTQTLKQNRATSKQNPKHRNNHTNIEKH